MASYSQEVMADGPVGYWKLDGTSGSTTTLPDSSGNNRHLTSNTAATLVTGRRGNAFQTNPNWASVSGGTWQDTNGLTVELWAKVTSNTGVSQLFSRTNEGSLSTQDWQFRRSTANKAEFVFITSAQSVITSSANSGPTITDGNWHHIAAIWDKSAGTICCYVDGALYDTKSGATSINTWRGLTYLGYGPSSGANIAIFDDVAIYNKPLSLTRLQAHYNATLVDPDITPDLWVWNGVTELPANVTVWNGTTEIEASIEITAGGGIPASPIGVPPGTVLTTLTSGNNPNGSATFPGDGTYRISGTYTYTGWKFNHRVDVRAGTVTFINCQFCGDPADTTTQNTALLLNTTGTGVVSATNCTFNPTTAYNGIDGIRGSKISAQSCEFTRTVDGGQLWGDGSCTIVGNRFYGLLSYPTGGPPSGSGPTHNDGLQISSGSAYVITGNAFEGAGNSGVIVTQALGTTENVRIENNTFNLTGNGADVNVDDKGTGPIIDLVVKNNIFKKDLAKYQIYATTSTYFHSSFVYNPNTWDDGTPVPSRGWAIESPES